jgi:hypothetical protein
MSLGMPGIRNSMKNTILALRDPNSASMRSICSFLKSAATNGLPSARARKKLAADPTRIPATDRSDPIHPPKR